MIISLEPLRIRGASVERLKYGVTTTSTTGHCPGRSWGFCHQMSGPAKRNRFDASAYRRFRFLGFYGAQCLLEDAKKSDKPGLVFSTIVTL
jgi:hypothetical protein